MEYGLTDNSHGSTYMVDNLMCTGCNSTEMDYGSTETDYGSTETTFDKVFVVLLGYFADSERRNAIVSR